MPISISSHATGDNLSSEIPIQPAADINGPSGSYFVENKGQWDHSITFMATTSFGNIALVEGGILLDLRTIDETRDVLDGHVVRIDFVGSNPVRPIGDERILTEFSYFLGNDTSRWASGAHGYRKVVHHDLWEGIDLVYRSGPEGLKYDLIVTPGANPSDIRFSVVGGEVTSEEGKVLSISTPVGSISDSGLYVLDGDGEEVEASFTVDGRTYGFTVGDYDRTRPLIIDPNMDALDFSTFVGGSSFDEARSMDIDGSGNIYIAGITASNDFPMVAGHYQSSLEGYSDCYVCKMKPDGSDVVLSSYIGGENYDYAYCLLVDENGCIYMAGFTTSLDFPTTAGAYDVSMEQDDEWCADLFSIKLTSDATSLVYSTFIGGSSDEITYGNHCIDIDDEGNIYFIGNSRGGDFPVTSNAYQRTLSMDYQYDIVVFKLSSDGSALLYSTYFGGVEDEKGRGLMYNGAGSVIITGSTASSDFPVTSDAFSNYRLGACDGFISILTVPVTGNGILNYSTFFGGSGQDYIDDLTIGDDGYFYICGQTWSKDLPISEDAYRRTVYNETSMNRGRADGFVSVLDIADSELISSTYIGGDEHEEYRSIEIGQYGSIHIGGMTKSANYPLTEDCFQSTTNNKPNSYFGIPEVAYSILTNDCTGLIYSTFIGGVQSESFADLHLDGGGEVTISGATDSSDFPVTDGAYRTTFMEGDSFVLRLKYASVPEAPMNLKERDGCRFVNISWDVPVSNGGSAIIDYSIYRGTSSGEYDTELSSGNRLYFNDTSVENGLTYFYTVTALTVVGCGPLSPEVEAMPSSIPSPPEDFRLDTGSNRIDITWSGPLDDGGLPTTGYIIFKSERGGPFITVEVGPDEVSYSDIDVINGVRYDYFMVAKNDRGMSPPTETLRAGPTGISAPPEYLVAVYRVDRINLTWDAPQDDGGSPILGYNLYRTRTGDLIEDIFNIPADDLYYEDTEIVFGVEMVYQITAVNENGESNRSNPASVIIYTIPGPPTDLISAPTNGSILLKWDRPAFTGGRPIMNYSIFRSIEDSSYVRLDTISERSVEYIDRDVVDGRTYRYYVTASNEEGESAPSNITEAVLVGRPSAPIGLTATSGDSRVSLKWEAPLTSGGSPLTGFAVLRGSNEHDLAFLTEIPALTRDFVDTTVLNGMHYEYAVQAINIIGRSELSNVVPADPKGIPGPPILVQAISGDSSAIIKWSLPGDDGGANVTHVTLTRSSKDGPSKSFNTTDLDGEYRDTGLTNGMTYTYSMTASNEFGTSAPSHSISVVPTGVPTAPRSLRVVEFEGKPKLMWEPPLTDGGSPLTAYKVHRTSDGSAPETMIISANMTLYVDIETKPGSTYTYSISALNANGESVRSNDVTFSADPSDGINIALIIQAALVFFTLIIVIVLVAIKLRKGNGPSPNEGAIVPVSGDEAGESMHGGEVSSKGAPSPIIAEVPSPDEGE